MQMLQEDGRNHWREVHLCVNLIMCRYETAILQAEAIKPSKAGNILTALVRIISMFLEVMKALVTYFAALSFIYKFF